MSSVYKKLQNNGDNKFCLSFLKDQLVDAARYAKVTVSGTKADLCARILNKIKPIVKPIVEAPKPQAKPVVIQAKPQAKKDECRSHKNEELKDFLKHFDHPKVYKMNKDQMCSALEDYIKQGKFQWAKPHYAKIAAQVYADIVKPAKPAVVQAKPQEKGKPLEPISVTLSFKDFKYFVNNFKVIDIFQRSFIPCKEVRDHLNKQYSLEYALDNVDKYQVINSESIKDRRYDLANQETIRCLIDEVFSLTEDKAYRDKNNVFMILTNNLKKYFKIRPISSGSAFGSAFFVYPKNKKQEKLSLKQLRDAGRTPFAVMKLVQNYGDAENLSTEYAEIAHEIAIGYCLNTLRSKIPYFAYTYKGFICDILQEGKNEDISCSAKNSVEATIISFQEYVQGRFYDMRDARETIQVFLQVAHALYVAEQEFKYMHNDLHSENVIIKRLNSPITVNLVSDKYNITLTNVICVPFIIDYGMNALTTKDGIFLSNLTQVIPKHPANNLISRLGCCPDTYFLPSYDIYRYVTHVLQNFNDTIYLKVAPYAFALFKDELKRANREEIEMFSHLLNAADVETYAAEYSNRAKFKTLNWGHKDLASIFKKDCGDWIVAFIKAYKSAGGEAL